ncbi:MAG TPA: CoA-acylating methylmalonate-semialdehyde dehydrogenase [Thermoleophilaceae bacterium]|jgi:malonate-semialdehyde dehydrogenase (acetylating)/methylmalonate-semialdehyde dehydrogenase
MGSTATKPAALHHWIAGRADRGSSTRSGPVYDPASGNVIATLPYASEADVDRAVRAAARAAEGWAAMAPSGRARVLRRYLALLADSAEAVAAHITREQGKALDEAREELQCGLEALEAACGVSPLLEGRFSQGIGSDVDCYSLRQPLGIVAGVTPFDDPLMVPLWMYPLALACGNAFLLKPSERVPSAALLAADLLHAAGLPPGLLSVVNGDRETVEHLIAHPGIAAISFVGSTPAARGVYARGIAAGKRVQALGGAKNHAVVLPDADLSAAADCIVAAAYRAAGQRCTAVSVAVAVGEIADDFVAALVDRAQRLTVGRGLAPGTDVGPVTTGASRRCLELAIEAGVREGAKLVLDGRYDASERGFFVGPTVLDGVRPGMTVYDDELFGPVLAVVRVDSFDEALALIDANPFGNGAALFTRDGGAARAFQRRVGVGTVAINVACPTPIALHSFGGWKASLFGDLQIHGEDGVAFYTRTKVVTARWPARPQPGRLAADGSSPAAVLTR